MGVSSFLISFFESVDNPDPFVQYTIVFCSADVISLVVQAIGGASAAIAVQSTQIPAPDPNKGAKFVSLCSKSSLGLSINFFFGLF